jgi:hypothetical protein
MRPYNIYIWDFFFYNGYVLFSFLSCWIIFFYNREIIFLFEVMPVVSTLIQKRFIATQLTQIFNTTWFLCTLLSFMFNFPLFIYNINLFFIPSWYTYQIRFYRILLTIFITIFFLIYYFCQLVVLPHIIFFFLYWEILNEYSLLKIEAEISLFFYIKWIFILKFFISFFISVFFHFSIFLFYILNNKNLYFLLQHQKKKLLFSLTCITFLIVPPDFLLQLLIVLLLFLLIECFLFFVCIKLFFNSKKLTL